MGRIRESSLISGWNGVSDFQTDPYLVRFMYFAHEVSFWFWPSYQCNRIEVKRDSHNTMYLKCLFFCILSVFSCLENWETTWNHHVWLVDQVSSWTALGQVVLTSLHSAQREVHGAIRDEPDAWHVPTWLPGYRLIHWLYWIKLRISKQAYVVLTCTNWGTLGEGLEAAVWSIATRSRSAMFGEPCRGKLGECRARPCSSNHIKSKFPWKDRESFDFDTCHFRGTLHNFDFELQFFKAPWRNR
jgi:hypothetical protein